MRILLVDYSKQSQFFIKSMLEKRSDIQVVNTIFSAANAELYCLKNQIDLILMDVMMPVMDGISATMAIRAMDREDAKKIPIIAMTANAFAEDAKACIEAGMDQHIAKPFDMDKVAVILKSWVGKTHSEN